MKNSAILVLTLSGIGAAAGCGTEPLSSSSPAPSDLEWSTLTYGAGQSVQVAVQRPDNYSDTGRHPVVLALPWGQGTPDLVAGMIDAYWSSEAPGRGYLVVSPSIRGTSLATEADEFLPALFAWMEERFSFDPDRVALVGASNGGRGVFHALVSAPERFHALIGMPGSFTGSIGDLVPFAGKPAWLMVGEHDTSWRVAAEDTRTALEAAGIPTELEVLSGQGHVLFVPQGTLMDWVEEALGGS